jgi:glycerophosphoryl diester phosphodiesterase
MSGCSDAQLLQASSQAQTYMSRVKPMTAGLPLLAHRGYAARYPENTQEALRAAVAAGARHLEFDIQLSADRVPFLLHDADFRRTAGVERTIFSMLAADVAGIAAGEPQRFGKQFDDVRVPRLAEVVDELAAWPQVQVFVEIKRESIEYFGLDAVLDAVLPVVLPVLDRCVIISFERDAVAEARRRTACRIGWALRAWTDASRVAATTLAPDYLFCNVTRLPAAPAPLWSGVWTWVVYEITDAAMARQLAERGAGMIETMAYVELAAALNSNDAANGESGTRSDNP